MIMPPAERIESLSVALSVTAEEARRTLAGDKAEEKPPPPADEQKDA
jgi:hypothetical protein